MGLQYRVEGTLAGLSMVGSLLIIVSYLSPSMKRFRRHPVTLVFRLSCCDFLFSSSFFVTSVVSGSAELEDNDVGCLLQAVVAQFFGLASISYNGVISLNLFLTLKDPFRRTAQYAGLYHFWVWSLAAGTTSIMVAFNLMGWDGYGPSGDGTCWIQQSGLRLLFFVPLLVSFTLSILALIMAAMRIRRISQMRDATRRTLISRMGLYTTAFVVLWSGPLAHRLAEYILQGSDQPEMAELPALVYLNVVGQSAQGMVNSLIWLTTPTFSGSIRRQLLSFVGCLFPRFSRESKPLLGSNSAVEAATEEYKEEDIQALDVVLRRDVIACVLHGIHLSVPEAAVAFEDAVLDGSDLAPYKHCRTWQQAGSAAGLRRGVKVAAAGTDDNADLLQSAGGDSSAAEQLESPVAAAAGGWALPRHTFAEHAPAVFHSLRLMAGLSPERYLSSLSPAELLGALQQHSGSQQFSEGRSGSFMFFSPDKLLIIKTIPASESAVLRRMLFPYHRHLLESGDSLLLRVLGHYSIDVDSLPAPLYVVVLGNAFASASASSSSSSSSFSSSPSSLPPLDIHEKYDLKGSWINRGSGMDQDLQQQGHKLRLAPQDRDRFLEQLEADVTFLCDLGIMDYSLLVGFHFQSRSVAGARIDLPSKSNTSTGDNLYGRLGFVRAFDDSAFYRFALIDIFTAYDAKKKRERFFKVFLLCRNRQGLSVMPPPGYKERFLDAIRSLTAYG